MRLRRKSAIRNHYCRNFAGKRPVNRASVARGSKFVSEGGIARGKPSVLNYCILVGWGAHNYLFDPKITRFRSTTGLVYCQLVLRACVRACVRVFRVFFLGVGSPYRNGSYLGKYGC